MDTLDLTLDERHDLPDELLRINAREIRKLFPDPCLIELKGRSAETVFVSVLLHGNETTGFSVLQRLARWMRSHPLPRTMLVFIGNVRAAEAGLRHLAGQPDYNRIWNGGDSAEHALANRVLEKLAGRKLFAAIDILIEKNFTFMMVDNHNFSTFVDNIFLFFEVVTSTIKHKNI